MKHDFVAAYAQAVQANRPNRTAEAMRYRQTLGGLADTAVTNAPAQARETAPQERQLTADEINAALFG